MGSTRSEVYLHFVWATHQRLPLTTPDCERDLYRVIQDEAQRLRCVVIRTGGIEDHIHILLKTPTVLSPAQAMQRLKGVSSTTAREEICPGEFFGWQEGYGVFSVSRTDVRRVTAYIANQRRHHAAGTVWPSLEETGDDAED